MYQPLVIFGAGGHGKVVLDAALRAQTKIEFLLDDAPEGRVLLGKEVLAPDAFLAQFPQDWSFIVAIGLNSKRQDVFCRLQLQGGKPQSVIHPFTSISSSARIGAGTVVCAGAVINPDASVGRNCIINTLASVDHDCVIEDHVHIAPGARLGGEVLVGEETLIGIGAVVLPGIRIGKKCVIGAGSVVTRDIPDGVTAYGVPAGAVGR
jgi:sugar O-acyltransferase (sialic acid O-acetyltransferase NeuD family)